MKILISNDDGIHARGIRALAHVLSQDPQNEVYVVAPDRERSATGHALTLHKPIRVEEIELDAAVKGAWWTTGTPSDCVKFAVGALLAERPDVIVSGINRGANLGSEILYSGTVSAAMEGALLNIPSIAVSLVGSNFRHFDSAAEYIARLLRVLPLSSFTGHKLLNVNIPDLPVAEIAGVRMAELGIRIYRDYYEKRVDPRGKVYYWLAGEAAEEEEPETSDSQAVAAGYISITPLSFNMTDLETLRQMQGWSELTSLVDIAASSVAPAADGSIRTGQAGQTRFRSEPR